VGSPRWLDPWRNRRELDGVSLDRAPSPTVYLPYWQSVVPPGVNSMDLVVVIRTTTDPKTMASSLRGVIRGLDQELALPAFRVMDDVVTDSVGQRRFQMALVLLFAVAGTLLASLGIYGVVSYSVAQRTNEMGIRLALGALPDIRRLVITQGFTPVPIGLGAGVLVSAGFGRLLGTLCSASRRPIRSPWVPWLPCSSPSRSPRCISRHNAP